MSKHTPGPWTIRKTLRRIVVFSESRRWRDIAGLQHYNSPERESNARLIAAAPDMLAALEAICEHANEAWAALDHDYHEVLAGNLGDAVDQARATIAKAKGESE